MSIKSRGNFIYKNFVFGSNFGLICCSRSHLISRLSGNFFSQEATSISLWGDVQQNKFFPCMRIVMIMTLVWCDKWCIVVLTVPICLERLQLQLPRSSYLTTTTYNDKNQRKKNWKKRETGRCWTTKKKYLGWMATIAWKGKGEAKELFFSVKKSSLNYS